MNYYNEFDPDAAQWLRNLITAGLIPAGDVDERSIEDVRPNDLRGYTQCHFFAGIGGWPLALNLAGWPRDMPAWSGSCPCQPFSAAGKGDGFADERHLWPAWFHLIRECRPNVVFGEQVASAIRHGWLDLVSADLEAEGYAVGGAVLGAHSVGAPHIRQRLYWVADAASQRLREARECGGIDAGRALGDASGRRREVAHQHDSGGRASNRIGEAGQPGVHGPCFMGDADNARLEGRDVCGQRPGKLLAGSAGLESAWRGEWQTGADGKARLIESGLEPLAHGVSARVVRLRGYGNAIVPQTAAAFIRAFVESSEGVRTAA